MLRSWLRHVYAILFYNDGMNEFGKLKNNAVENDGENMS